MPRVATRGPTRSLRRSPSGRIGLPALLWLVFTLVSAATARADDEPYRTLTLRGQVVWLGEALQAAGIAVDADAAHTLVVLQGADGQLTPIVKDARGRGFWLDERLRQVDLELLVRQRRGSPLAQVIRVVRLLPEGRFELDYWCDVCAIPMFERKPCECCQGETRIRLRRLDARGEPLPEEPAGG